MKTLPPEALDQMPFSEEPMHLWGPNTDIHVFATNLYISDNTLDTSSKLSFGLELCMDEEKDMREYIRLFTKNLMETIQMGEKITYIDFYQDARFGKVAKYAIAFQCCIHRLLEDAGFYSLAHVLEARSDLECSLLLASHFYYKQATSMLRNILEETFLPIHFCDNIAEFNAWKSNNFRTPPLRGSKGLIKRLVSKSILDNSLATKVADLYGDLSAYIHGSENTLIHQKIHLGEIHSVDYNENMYNEWCKLFCDCVETCILLLKINSDQWNGIRAAKFKTLAQIGKTLCHTCHNEDKFDRWILPSQYCYTPQDDDEFTLVNIEDLTFYRYKCQVCGHLITVNAKETPLKLVMCLSIDDLPSGSTITKLARLVRGTDDPYCEWYAVQPVGEDVITPLLHPDQEKPKA